MAASEAVGRLISLSLRLGIPIRAVRDQLRGISCDRAVGVGHQKVLSAPDAIAQAIERYLAEKEGVQEELPIDVPVAVGAGTMESVQGEYMVDHTAQTPRARTAGRGSWATRGGASAATCAGSRSVGEGRSAPLARHDEGWQQRYRPRNAEDIGSFCELIVGSTAVASTVDG